MVRTGTSHPGQKMALQYSVWEITRYANATLILLPGQHAVSIPGSPPMSCLQATVGFGSLGSGHGLSLYSWFTRLGV